MNVLQAYLKKIGRTMLTLVPLCCTLAACDNAIYDDEGDCSVTYRLNFRFDLNINRADAFAKEVNSVNLYAFDKSGTLVWQHFDHGEALHTDGYAVTLDLPAGDYRMLAWCGLRNEGTEPESFSVPTTRIGQTRIEEMQCTLNREHEATGEAFSRRKLHPLYHGMLDVTLPDTNDGSTFDYSMELTKDTNRVRIILQQLSGEPVDVRDFTFRIEQRNGLMEYDNALNPSDEMITYEPHYLTTGTASMGFNDYPALRSHRNAVASRTTITSVSVAIADLTIGRLLAEEKVQGQPRKHQATLVVESQGNEVARIPLTDYALLLKDSYDFPMTDQEFLDRQDHWDLTFFLDENRKWISTSIIINSWRLVLQNADFGGEEETSVKL